MARKQSKRSQTITHTAADGVSRTSKSTKEDESLDAGETTDDESSGSLESIAPPSRKRSLLLPLAIICIVGQWIISVSLRKGIVKDHLMPQLQQQIDNGLKWSQFNESLLWQRFNQSMAASDVTQENSRPGFRMAKEGAQGKHPVVMIPGFVTSGLEVWQGTDCAKKYFRQRMWGGVGSVQHWLMERHCVMEHLALDPVSGKDPEGIRLRAAQGFEAADYFMGNYWVWGKVLENLADVGYDGSLMSMESYDWRLSFPKLEERDGYLTKLKYKIEAFQMSTGKKVIITSHSLGAMLVHYFFAWVSEQDKDWVDKHIHAYVNIAGAHLGVPKATSALLSGEMSDTIIMGAVGTLLEQFIGRKARRSLFATWGSLYHMLPKGGDEMWQNMITLTDGKGNPKEMESSEDYYVDEAMNMDKAIESFTSQNQHPTSHVEDFLIKLGGGFQQEKTEKPWQDASKTPLPNAPNMKIYCLYGVGLPTEVAYFYKRNPGDETEHDDTSSDAPEPAFIIDTAVEDEANNITHGVKYADGDGSVPLASLGYLCADGWRTKGNKLNPAKISVVTREYHHKEEFTVDDPMRRGPYSGDHVDILGHVDMLTDLMKIVTDQTDEVTDEFISDVFTHGKKTNPKNGKKKRRSFRKKVGKMQQGFGKFCSGVKKKKFLSALAKLPNPFQKKEKLLRVEQ